MTIEGAVEDIVTRRVGELWRNAFGEESKGRKVDGMLERAGVRYPQRLGQVGRGASYSLLDGSSLITYRSEGAVLRRAYRLPIQGS